MSVTRDAEVMVMQPSTAAVATRAELSVEELIGQVTKIQQVMHAVMKDGEHYGKIPGTPKPTLLKAGAEKLCLLFRLDPEYAHVREWDGTHLTVYSKCTLYHISSGERRGSGEGSCSTKEAKYAYRGGSRKCPKCGAEAIIKGKADYGGGWLCFKKKDGCGAKFADNDKAITGQEIGRVSNPDLPDQYNTVLKMSNKRALVAAVLNVTAASDLFTQDLEDLRSNAEEHTFRPTPEQLQAAREEEPPPRREDKAPDLEEGFGGDAAPGEVVINKRQQTLFWARCGKRADLTSYTRETIGREVLASFGLEKSEHIPAARFTEVLAAVDIFALPDPDPTNAEGEDAY
jgi:hypothetical protein